MLAHQVDDHPAAFTLLDVRDVQRHGFRPPQSTAKEHSEKGSVPLAFQRRYVRRLDELFGLPDRQPVPQPNALLLDPFDAHDPGGKLRRHQAVIGRLSGELTEGKRMDAQLG